MALKEYTEIKGALRTKKYREVLEEISKSSGDKLIADNNIIVTVNGKSVRGSTVMRSLMVDALVSDLSFTQNGGVRYDKNNIVIFDTEQFTIQELKEAHELAAAQAEAIFFG